jgi:hypothetical protein
MSTQQEKTSLKERILPHNWNSILAKECRVTKSTVTKAIRYNGDGRKAEMVRAKFKELFG